MPPLIPTRARALFPMALVAWLLPAARAQQPAHPALATAEIDPDRLSERIDTTIGALAAWGGLAQHLNGGVIGRACSIIHGPTPHRDLATRVPQGDAGLAGNLANRTNTPGPNRTNETEPRKESTIQTPADYPDLDRAIDILLLIRENARKGKATAIVSTRA